MNVIYKYPIETKDEFTIELPRNAKLLTVQIQHHLACLWVLLDKDAEKTNRKFALIGTGNPVPYDIEDVEYINTFQLYNGDLVFHLFEILR